MRSRMIAYMTIACAVMLGATVISAQQPNIILVMTDDQSYADLACHGNPHVKTPNIDTLHSQSVRLTNFHVSPTCSPTRAALMTGRYNNRTGVWHTIMGRSLLRADETTMADIFAAGGYRTGIFGKWHLGDNYPFRPQDNGFQDVLVHKGGGIGQGIDYWGNDYFDDTYYRNGVREKFEGYCTDIWFDEAMKFIETNKDRPFFCYIPTNAAHGPFNVPDKYSDPYEAKGLESIRSRFYGMITNIDDNMGKLTQRLEDLNLWDNTILIFMTDNGGDKAGDSDKYNANMRSYKGSMFDGGHRVPFFINWPDGGLEGGRDIGNLTAHIDLLPTLIELCGLEKPSDVHFDGTSLTPLLTGDAADWPERTLVVDSQRVDHPIKWRRSATMTDRWRLINGENLYDIHADPGQRNDIAGQHPEVVQTLRADYEKWWDDVSERFADYPAIIVGAPEQNPTLLMSHDVHGKVIWNHNQVSEGEQGEGFWAIDVAQNGAYEFAVRRWPREVDRPITGPLSAHQTEPDHGRLRATQVRLKVAGFDQTQPIPEGASEVVFKVNLQAGETRCQAWLVNGLGDGQVHGAYYVYAERVGDA